jgi:cell division protease FtsH
MAENSNDPEKKSPRRPLKALPPDGFSPKVLLIWLCILTAVTALIYFSPARQPSPKELTVYEVLELARAKQIKKLVLRPDPTAGGNATFQINGEATTLEAGGTTYKFVAAGTLTDPSIIELQRAGAIEQPYNTWLKALLPQILFLLVMLLLLYFFVFRQLKSAGKGALSFGKSRAKMLARDRDKVTFADVAGCDEAKEEVSEIVDFLKDPKKFTKIGGRIPKGLLLVGPPGTGKTLLAKAVAGEAEVPFFSISGSDFVEMFVGVGASRVRDMFEQGRKNAPCIIFIDEIDAVGRQRGTGLGGGHDEREQTLNSMLVEMDGFDTTEGVIIMAATNRADVLDGALLRPGRFDRQVNVDLPDLVGREQILKVHAKKISLSEDVNLTVIARGTPGFSGADLANLLNESALIAARRNKKKVEPVDVEDARDKIIWGRERRRAMDDKERKLIAWHEAGHAVVQAVLDDGTVPVYKVTIIPRGRSLGSTSMLPTKDILTTAMRKMLDDIACSMGGRIAEELVTGDISNGAYGDIKHATRIARAMVCDYGMSPLGPVSMGENQETVFLGRDIGRTQQISEETARRVDAEVSRIIAEQYARAKEIILAHREALDKIAAALLEYETIEGKHVLEILQQGEIKSPVVTVSPAKPAADKDPAKPAAKSAPELPPIGGTASPLPA